MKNIIVGAVIISLLTAIAVFSRLTQHSAPNIGDTTRRISADEVTLSNLPRFEAEIRREIPVGMPKKDVEALLSRQKIPHFFAEPNSGSGENTFYGRIKNIGSRLGIPASLAMEIRLDEGERVANVRFQLDYDAP